MALATASLDIVCLYLGISKPSTSSSHLILLYSSGRVALGKTQVGADLGLNPLGNPRACAPTGQLQTMLEHHAPALAHLILLEGWRLVFSGQHQSYQLTGLSVSLPWTCQQQPRLNFKRVYTQPTQRVHPEYPIWMIGEAVPLEPTGHLLHQATLPKWGVIAALPNT